MSAIDWSLEDLKRFAAILNAPEPTYEGVDFYGWSVEGVSFQPPEATVKPRAAFGRVGLGRARTLQASGDHLGAPARTGSVLCLELHFAGAADADVYTAIYDDAVATLYAANSSALWVEPSTWRPPRKTDLRATDSGFDGFMPVRGDLGYWTGRR